jgi:hypothetical protein
MTVRTRWLWALAVVVGVPLPAFAAPAPAPPGSSSLAVIPAQAPIVVQVHGVERTKDRVVTLVKNAVPDFGPLVAAQLEKALKEGLEDKKLAGLEKDGPIFVAFLELPGPDTQVPAMAVIARVSKYTEFRDGLLSEDERKSLKANPDGGERTEIHGQEIFFLDRNGWAIVTPHKDTAALLNKNNPGLDAKLSKEITKRFLDADVSVYVNLATVNKQFGEQIKEAKDQFFGLMDQFGGQDKATMDMVKRIYGSIFQVMEDGRAFVLALDFRPEGLSLHLAANIGADTPTNKFLKEQKPASLAGINTLPAGNVTYTATELAPSLLRSLAPLMFGGATDDDAKKAMQAAIEQLVEAGNTSSLSTGSFPSSSLQVSYFKDPVKAAEAQLKLFRTLGEGAIFQQSAIKGSPEIKEKVQTHRGFTFNYAKVVWDLDKLSEQFPGGGDDAKKAMKKLMGESMEIWFGTDGKVYLTVSGKDWADAKSKVDTFLDGKTPIGKESAFTDTRKQLPAEATMLMFADAGRFASVMTDYMLGALKAVPGLPFNLPESVKPVETKPAFFGTAIVMQPEYGSFDFFLPVTAVQEVRKVLMPLFMGGD